jgi:hypothetical protein
MVYGDTSVNVILLQWELAKVRRAEDDYSEKWFMYINVKKKGK